MCEEVENLSRFTEAGGRVALGDDYGNPGIDLGMPIRDMQLMQEAGMTNMEIIVAATRNGAFACGLQDDLGTVEAGKLADLIVLNDDPLTDLVAFADIAYVIKEGVIIRSP
jgi:imidazolonepropionase-like amidohydrolase